MYPHSHFLFPYLLGLAAYDHKIALLAGIVGVLVDLDHFVYYALKHKDFSFKHAWRAAVVTHEKGERTFVHHKKGFVILTVFFYALYYVNPTVSIVHFLGYYTHLLLDYGHLNVLGIEGDYHFKILGLDFNLSHFEAFFDVMMVIAIILIF